MWASAAAHLPRYLAQAARPPVARRASLRSDSGVAPATFSAIPSPFAVDTVARPGPPCPPLDVAALRFFFFFFLRGGCAAPLPPTPRATKALLPPDPQLLGAREDDRSDKDKPVRSLALWSAAAPSPRRGGRKVCGQRPASDGFGGSWRLRRSPTKCVDKPLLERAGKITSRLWWGEI